MGKYQNVDDFNKVIVANPKGKVVHLNQIASITDGVKEQTSLTRVNGNSAVGLNIIKQSGSNTVKVAEEVQKQLTRLKSQKITASLLKIQLTMFYLIFYMADYLRLS